MSGLVSHMFFQFLGTDLKKSHLIEEYDKGEQGI